jgi:Trypsin
MIKFVIFALLLATSKADTSNKTFIISIFGYDGDISSFFRCLGTMITNQHVLTVASCVRDLKVEQLQLEMYPLDSTPPTPAILYDVNEVFFHPKLESDDQLAILKVSNFLITTL